MKPDILRVGLVQQSMQADPEANIRASLREIQACAQQGAQLVVLPELHTHRYFCQTEDTTLFDYATAIPGPVTARFAAAAQRHGVVLVTSLFERRAPGLYHNTAVVFERDGTLLGTYRKMHIPDDPAYYEKFYFTPGDLGFEPIQSSMGKLGVLVCWDQWYPEAARLMALAGAEVLIYPTAIGWESTDAPEEQTRQYDAWQLVQRGHAVANGLPLVAVNRTGHEPDPSGHMGGIQFWGQSFVCGPQGEWLHRAPAAQAQTAVVEIDRARTESVRRIWPFLRDRRIEAYGELGLRYRDR